MKPAPGFAQFVVIIVIILVAIAAFGAYETYFILQKDNPKGTSDVQKPINQTLVSPSTKTDDWKTYTGKQVMFKYPSNWSVTQKNGVIDIDSPDLDETNTERGFDLNKGGRVSIFFSTIPSGGDINTDFKHYFIESGESVPAEKISDSKVSGVPSIYYTYLINKHKVYGSFIIFNNKIVDIGLVSELGKEEMFKTTYDQILSTFKFLN